MKAKEILSKLTGFSTPIGGIQWAPPVSEKQIASDLIRFLEDRRVLFEPEEREGADYCRISVEKIRDELTDVLKKVEFHSDVAKHLQKFRRAARKFCSDIGAPEFSNLPSPVRLSLLKTALGELRMVGGQVVGVLSVAYELDVDDDLASAIPFKPIY